MATFIKAGFWEKLCKPCKGYKGWLNLDEFVDSRIPAPAYKVYTALLTQTGPDNPATTFDGGDPIIIGQTYEIVDNGGNGWDFTNIGAPNNNIGTKFVATGTTPANWGVNAQLDWNTATPVATVLENTIGNIWFNYITTGRYRATSDELFTLNKTYSTIESQANDTVGDGIKTATITYDTPANNAIVINTGIVSETSEDSFLINTPFEIRVYN